MGAGSLIQQSEMESQGPRNACLLGREHGEYGVVTSIKVGAKTAAAISVGSDTKTPSNRFKTDKSVRNEDALCVVVEDQLALYAVADAHYGPESSHTLISRIHQATSGGRVPASLADLTHVLDSLQDGPPPATQSETTLLVVVYDRNRREGFGISFGDSTFAIAGPDRQAEPLNHRNNRFVSANPDQLPLEGAAFGYQAQQGDTLLTFTDGIDECHYRSPETSVRPHHISEIVASTTADIAATVTDLAELALAGVGGHPGGQDNIAVIGARA